MVAQPAIAYWSGQRCVSGSSHQSLPGTVDSSRFFCRPLRRKPRDSQEAVGQLCDRLRTFTRGFKFRTDSRPLDAGKAIGRNSLQSSIRRPLLSCASSTRIDFSKSSSSLTRPDGRAWHSRIRQSCTRNSAQRSPVVQIKPLLRHPLPGPDLASSQACGSSHRKRV